MTRGLLELHSLALDSGGVLGSITGCEAWAGDSIFLHLFVGSPPISWGNRAVAVQ